MYSAFIVFYISLFKVVQLLFDFTISSSTAVHITIANTAIYFWNPTVTGHEFGISLTRPGHYHYDFLFKKINIVILNGLSQ
jgi:hypothetical protein